MTRTLVSDMPVLRSRFDVPEMLEVGSIVTGQTQDLDVSSGVDPGYRYSDADLIVSELLSGPNRYFRPKEVIREVATTLNTKSQGREHDTVNLFLIFRSAPDEDQHGDTYGLEDKVLMNWPAVRAALANPQWDFRTIAGIVKETGLSEDEVCRELEEHRFEIRQTLSRDRQPIFTLKSRPRKLRETLADLRLFASKSF